MLDNFDHALLEAVQRDDGRTADELSEVISLSSSAIARRLRKLRREGWIERTIALLSTRLTARRVRALVLIQLHDHASSDGLRRLRDHLGADEQVQWCAEISGGFDMAALVDFGDVQALNCWTDDRLAIDGMVRRYETSIVKRTIRFAPFVAVRAAP